MKRDLRIEKKATMDFIIFLKFENCYFFHHCDAICSYVCHAWDHVVQFISSLIKHVAVIKVADTINILKSLAVHVLSTSLLFFFSKNVY